MGSGTMPVRVKEWIPDWEKELEVEKLVLAVVLVEQEEGGWLELRARLQRAKLGSELQRWRENGTRKAPES